MLVQLLIIQILTFIAVIFLLRFLFSRHLKTALDRLNTLHEENLAKEEELKEELRRAKEESQAQIEKGKEEAGRIIEEAKKDAVRQRLNIEEDAKVKAAKIISEGEVEAKKLKEQVSKDIQSQSVELASKMIAELLIEADKIALQYQFANEVIEEISRLPRGQFSVQAKEVKVTSSFTLLDRQKEALLKVLGEKIGFVPKMVEEIDANIIGGLILEIGGMVIDGTLKNKLQRIIPYLK